MYELFYRTEVNVICFLSLFWILYRTKTFQDKQTRNIIFARVIISATVLLFIDTILFFIDGKSGTFLYYLNWTLNCIYLILNGVVAYFWLSYVCYYIHGNKKSDAIVERCLAVPLAIFIIFVLSAPFNKLIFFINSENVFIEGSLYFIQAIITYGFFTYSSFIALLSLFRKRASSVHYHKYVIAFSFVLFPLSGGVFHMFFPEAKVVWQALSLGFLLVYIEFQFDLISRDALTGLNNRRAFDSRLNQFSEIQISEGKTENYIFMIDINFFKKINDKYGHPEGDSALIKTAEILKEILGSSNAFLCRYGGDEFAILNACTGEEAGALRIKIYQKFEEEYQKHDREYRLSVSIGYAPIKGTSDNAVMSAVKLADSNLYNEKDAMHLALENLE